MNEFLADIYNTRESIGASSSSDVEKLAEAQLLDEALRAEGIDIDRLPGETILKLAHQLLGDDSALVKAAAEGDSEAPAEEKSEEEKEEAKDGEEPFEEKVAQADFLGRVMAHSYWNEKTAIEKNAGAKDVAAKAWQTVKNKATKAKITATEPAHYYKAMKGMGKSTGEALKDTLKTHKGHAATAGGLLAAGGVGTAAALSGGKKKKASAIDILAEKRAMEWAAAHGLLQQPDEVKLASAVDRRAVEMLSELGIDVAAVEAAAQE